MLKQKFGNTVPMVLASVGVCAVAYLVADGYFGPFSQRVAALFGAHATRTGNPLVDSVAEHQPSSPGCGARCSAAIRSFKTPMSFEFLLRLKREDA
jgi:hypothetical protein